MQRYSNLILDIHLVEFIDAANSMISQHQSSSFDAKFTSLRIPAHTRCQTSSIACSSTTVDGPRKELADVLQELTLGRGWITNDANVDISSQLNAIISLLLDSAKQL